MTVLAGLITLDLAHTIVPNASAQQPPGEVVIVPVPQPARRSESPRTDARRDVSIPPETTAPIPPSRELPFRDWLAATWPAAKAIGVRREIFDQAVHGLQLDLSIPDLALPRDPGRSKGQAEFAKPPSEYLSEPSLAHLAAEGRALAAKHRALLAAIHHRFGTPPPIILAIWGRETAFGSYRLPHNAMRVLATQAYMGRRSDFFYNEFLLALRLLNEGHVRLNDMHSSWAGAMGPTQFLPSDFYKFAVDFDGDGRADVWNSLPDALASAAKQLVDYGWERDKPWGFEVFPRSTPDCTLSLPTFKRPVKEWLANGFGLNDGALSSWLDEPASLVMPAGNLGPAFLGLRNYDAIRSYNNSDVYVLFVGNLADRIGGSGAFKGRWMPVPPVTAMDVEKMQTALGDLGLYKGKADGQAGPLTRVAIGIYQKSHNLHLTCWPDSRILTHISSRNQ